MVNPDEFVDPTGTSFGIRWGALLTTIIGGLWLAAIEGGILVVQSIGEFYDQTLGALGRTLGREIRRVFGAGEFAGTPGSITDVVATVFDVSFEGVPPVLAYLIALIVLLAMLWILNRLRIAILGRET